MEKYQCTQMRNPLKTVGPKCWALVAVLPCITFEDHESLTYLVEQHHELLIYLVEQHGPESEVFTIVGTIGGDWIWVMSQKQWDQEVADRTEYEYDENMPMPGQLPIAMSNSHAEEFADMANAYNVLTSLYFLDTSL